MFGPKRDELKEGGWSLHDEMFHDNTSQIILWVIKNENKTKVHIDFVV